MEKRIRFQYMADIRGEGLLALIGVWSETELEREKCMAVLCFLLFEPRPVLSRTCMEGTCHHDLLSQFIIRPKLLHSKDSMPQSTNNSLATIAHCTEQKDALTELDTSFDSPAQLKRRGVFYDSPREDNLADGQYDQHDESSPTTPTFNGTKYGMSLTMYPSVDPQTVFNDRETKTAGKRSRAVSYFTGFFRR